MEGCAGVVILKISAGPHDWTPSMELITTWGTVPGMTAAAEVPASGQHGWLIGRAP